MGTEREIEEVAANALRNLENGNRTDAWEQVVNLPTPVACAVVAEMLAGTGSSPTRLTARSLFVNRADDEPGGYVP